MKKREREEVSTQIEEKYQSSRISFISIPPSIVVEILLLGSLPFFHSVDFSFFLSLHIIVNSGRKIVDDGIVRSATIKVIKSTGLLLKLR